MSGNYSESTRRRNPNLQQQLLGLPVPAGELLAAEHQEQVETEFQTKAEKWLEHRGYLRRTKDNIAGGVPPAGWQLHFPKAKGNPLVLDIVLLRVDKHYLEIELKTETGRVLRHQEQLCAMGGKLCRTMFELREAVEDWEAGSAEHPAAAQISPPKPF